MRPWQPVLSIAVLAATLLTTQLRTLRAPNDWAEAHWLLDAPLAASDLRLDCSEHDPADADESQWHRWAAE